MADNPYPLDFLSTIVNVNWGTSVSFIVISLQSRSFSPGAPPAIPTAALTLGKGQKLIQKQETGSQSTTPPTPTITKFFFVWMANMPFPTAQNFQNVVLPISPPVSYAGQLAQAVDINFSGVLPVAQRGLNPGVSGGFFEDSFSAAAYAAQWNAMVAKEPSGSTLSFFNADGGQTTVPLLDAFAAEIDITSTSPGSGTAVFSGNYLIATPVAKTTLTVAVKGANDNAIMVSGYHADKQPASFDQVPNTPDNVATADRKAAGTFTVTAQLNTKPKPSTAVTVS